MWSLVLKEKRHAGAKSLLGILKLGINMTAWILAYAIYSKSAAFIKKAEEIMKSPEYMSSDMLGTEKIRLVYMSGILLTGLIAVGVVILFLCIVCSDIKKKKSKMGILMALGYDRKDLCSYFSYHIFIDTVVSVVISGICALVAWQLFLAMSDDYADMLEYVGLKNSMDMTGIIYAVILALCIQLIVLVMSLGKSRQTNIRMMLADR